MSPARLILALVGAAAIGGGISWYALSQPGTPAEPPGDPEPAAKEPTEAPPPELAEGATAEPKAEPKQDPTAGMLLLPDGGYVAM